MHSRAVHLAALLAGVAMMPMTLPQEAYAQAVLLKPKFVQGRTTYLEISQSIENTLSEAGQGPARKGTFQRTFGVWHKVEAASPDRGTRVVLTYDRIHLSIGTPMGSTSFDSDVDDPTNTSNPLAMAMGPMLGMSMTMELDEDNRIASFTGMEAIRKRIEGTTGGGPMYGQIKDELVDDGYRVMWGDSRFVFYANKVVRVGDSWTNSLRQRDAALGELVFEYNCKLQRAGTEDGRKVAVVAYVATIRPASSGEPQPDAIGRVSKLIAGEFEGTATYDLERGAFVRQASEGWTKINITSSDAVEAGRNVTLDQKIKSATRLLTEAERQKQKLENRRKGKSGPDE
jgi:hypothetical protein